MTLINFQSPSLVHLGATFHRGRPRTPPVSTSKYIHELVPKVIYNYP